MSSSRAASKPRSAKWRSAAATISARVWRPLVRCRTGGFVAGGLDMTVAILLARK
jgi:hypothetical protein